MPDQSAPPAAPAAPATRLSEQQFYSGYGWCLNPILRLSDLLQRMGQELERAPSWPLRWQQEETRINLFLFACAVACTVDDYLARRRYRVPPYVARLLRAPALAAVLQRCLDVAQACYKWLADPPIVRWRQGWDRCVDLTCEALTRGAEPGDAPWSELHAAFETLAAPRFPQPLLARRMALPTAFRHHDLSHHDIFALAHRFRVQQRAPTAKLVVIGARTAGGYFAPLVRAALAAEGWADVSWIAIRPKHPLSHWEKRRLRSLLGREVRVLVVDEYPRSGLTARVMLRDLEQFGIRPEQVTLAVPRPRTTPNWRLSGLDGVTLVTLEPDELFKLHRLAAHGAAGQIQEYYRDDAGRDVQLQHDAEIDAINRNFAEQYRANRYVHLKRVFQVQLGDGGHPAGAQRVIAKSVGWGWLGYHAYLAGTRLADFVPRVLGLRDGLLWMEWVGGADTTDGRLAPPALRPGSADALPRTLGAYVARRALCLRLTEDPCLDDPDYDLNGWSLLLETLRSVYGPFVGRLKLPALRRRLRHYASPVPTLIDGRMGREEWIATSGGFLKTDFEQHNFGSPELNVVDPAYDLAAAIFEFDLADGAAREMLQTYARESGDPTIGDRLLLYKLVLGTVSMQVALRLLAESPDDARNRRYHAARTFLIAELHRYCASLLPPLPPPAWDGSLFFFDLDGVFDCSTLGFPHTTSSGLAALALLRSHGFAPVLNTARSVADARLYTETYALPGGLAECGTVFFDAVAQREVSLVEPRSADQLARCRDALAKLPGMFLDPAYRYAVRAYRFEGQDLAAPPATEVHALLANCGCDRLTFTSTLGEVIIAPRETDKGRGLVAVQRLLEKSSEPVAAIGDSDRDVPMLEAADQSYAPTNSSARIRELARQGRCRVMPYPYQRGLLAAVRELLAPRARGGRPPDAVRINHSTDLLATLLRVAERSRSQQLLAALRWRSL